MRLPLIFAVTDVSVLPRQPRRKTQTLGTSVTLALLATIQERAERAPPGDKPKRPECARDHPAHSLPKASGKVLARGTLGG